VLQAAPTLPANCSHRPEPYFEWFYFHFVTPDGIAVNMVLHETDIFRLKRDPYGISEYIRIRPALYGSLSEPKRHQHHFRHYDGDHVDDRSAGSREGRSH
jgi:hypothetical protein